jgi:tRNA(Ile)-lysidine synthase
VKCRHPFVGKVEAQLHRLAQAAEGMIVAVSGGPDSVALLRALREIDAGPLVIAHLNHQLRGTDSDADEAFVRDLSTRLATGTAPLELRSKPADVRAMARAEGENLESVARRVRYDWLAEVAGETGLGWVATGHTADDQAETVLHRLLRGTGLKGLRGIAPRRELAPGVTLVRPLLGVTRAEVLAYLADIGQDFRQDTSNLDRTFTRNRIRHELLPILARDYNPQIVSCLAHLAEQADELYATEDAQARALLAAVERPRAGAVLVFDRRPLAAAARHRVREMFRLVWEREGWPMARMDFQAWDRVAAVARGEASGGDLPGGVQVRGRERVVQLSRHR